MKTLDQRKLNLLVHLAKIDGRFENSEQTLLNQFIKEKKLVGEGFDENDLPVKLSDFTDTDAKIELLYWALKVAQADGVIHPKELLFCNNLALKLKFKPDIISYFINNTLSNISEFEKQARLFLITDN